MAADVKKYKLFKVCKELNVGLETVTSFLQHKGLKVTGPNTAFSEEIYQEIISNFSREKEIADKIHLRKTKKDGEAASADKTAKTVEHKVPEKSIYIQTIEKSIEDRVEQIIRGEEDVEVKPVPKKRGRRTAKEIEAERSEEISPVERIIDRAPLGPKTAEKPARKEGVQDETKPGIPEITEKPVHDDKKAPATRAEEKKELDEAALAAQDKAHPKGVPVTDEFQKTKDEKRRKALEMIRKDERRKKHLLKAGDLESVDEFKRPRSRKPKRKAVDKKEVEQTVKKTLASLDDRLRRTKKRKKVKEETGEVIEENVIYASEFISANDLANLMNVPVGDVIKKCLDLGLVVSINQRLDKDTIELLANEWGFSVQQEKEYASDFLEELEDQEYQIADTEPRAPIITIMGHVDHGKTSLLDFIRKTNVVGGESGGITQHIGAYEVIKKGRSITFLDTPGHEAFTAMRARGAQVTDIVILVVAADDEVKPQTIEAIDHARAAGVKIIVAINKMDKSEANPDRIKKQLADQNILIEEWGGSHQSAQISAKKGTGIDELLDKVLVEADLLELKANRSKKARGTVIESRLDKGKGIVATILVQNGVLHIGDPFIAGNSSGKVRALLNEKDDKVNIGGPSQPVQVLGFTTLPQAGDRFLVMADEQTTKIISARRQRIKREQDMRQVHLRTLDQISENIKIGGVKELRIIVKADVDGSAEALSDALLKLATKEVSVIVIRKAVGTITESDVLLAAASDAIIIGFHVRPNVKAKELAVKEKIEIRNYKVVYDAINDVKLALEGLLGTEEHEQVLGSVEVREIFKISRLGTIAGCQVRSGKIIRTARVRLIRDDEEIYNGAIASLKRFKDDVREVTAGFECGIQIQDYNDLKVGDLIEAYEMVEKKRTLSIA
jgi:translation initiation factor IF-2